MTTLHVVAGAESTTTGYLLAVLFPGFIPA
jgi:hypothetical protein